jgi:YesN/AraC family two-component response regulator
MAAEKPYLIAGLSIRHLAKTLQIPAYQLSAFINQQFGMNFNDYINRLRIIYCVELIQMGSADGLNLRGLAESCGFNNRNTLTVAFRKFTGVNPSVFVRSAERKDCLYFKMNEWLPTVSGRV